MFPTEKKRVEVVLTDELASELDFVYAGIEELVPSIAFLTDKTSLFKILFENMARLMG